MIITSLRILDLTSEKKEGMSEGWLLWELMRILGFEKNVKFDFVKGKSHFRELLNEAKETYIHIGAHGDVISGETGLLTPREAVITSEDLVGIWRRRRKKPTLIVLSACKTGHIDFVRTFLDLGVKNVIAPLNDTCWDDAAIFSTMLYKLLIGKEMSPWVSYRNAICGYRKTFGKLSGAWRFYENGELNQVECY